MPNLSPEQYEFRLNVEYQNSSLRTPTLIVMPNVIPIHTEEEANLSHKQAQDKNTESTLVVIRTVTENIFHQAVESYQMFVADGQADSEQAAKAAVSYLRGQYPNEFNEFAKACWKAAQVGQEAGFPMRFPL